MRKQGVISKWNDEKGFGFIMPNDSKKTVFVHIKSFTDRNVRPVENQKVTYTLEKNDKGYAAINVSRSTDNPIRSKTNIHKKNYSQNYSKHRNHAQEKKKSSYSLPRRYKLIIILLAFSIFGKYIIDVPKTNNSLSSTSSSYTSTTPDNNNYSSTSNFDNPKSTVHNSPITYKNNSAKTAFSEHLSRVQVSGLGTVDRILRDDTEGKQHQKFILRLPWGQTLLVAHNIDIAKRLNGIHVGDNIEFSGQYEWNPKGGILHWTHHDPSGRHKDGWLKYHGQIYK